MTAPNPPPDQGPRPGRSGADPRVLGPHLDRERFDYEVAYLLPWKDALAKEIADQGIPVHCLNGGPGSWLGAEAPLVGARASHRPDPRAVAGGRVRYTPSFLGKRSPAAGLHRAQRLGAVPPGDVLGEPAHVPLERSRLRRYPSTFVDRSCSLARCASLHQPTTETRYHGVDVEAVQVWAHVNGVREELGIPERRRSSERSRT